MKIKRKLQFQRKKTIQKNIPQFQTSNPFQQRKNEFDIMNVVHERSLMY